MLKTRDETLKVIKIIISLGIKQEKRKVSFLKWTKRCERGQRPSVK